MNTESGTSEVKLLLSRFTDISFSRERFFCTYHKLSRLSVDVVFGVISSLSKKPRAPGFIVSLILTVSDIGMEFTSISFLSESIVLLS